MEISIAIEFLVLTSLLNFHRHLSFLGAQADSSSCRKQVECFICDSRETSECEDARNFSQTQIPVRLCDDYCLKMWSRDFDDNKTHGVRYVRRDCHKIFRYHIKKAETCYKHKKHHEDSLCLCGSDRCNSGESIKRRSNLLVFMSLFLLSMVICLV